MSAEAGFWQVGPVGFRPSALIVTLFVGLLVWGLTTVWVRFRAARIPVLLMPVGLGVWAAYGGLSAPSGFVAGYAFGSAWIASLVTALGSLLLLPLRLTRRAGAYGLIAAGIILITFYITFFAGYGLGLYDWWGDTPVPIPRVEPK